MNSITLVIIFSAVAFCMVIGGITRMVLRNRKPTLELMLFGDEDPAGPAQATEAQ